MQLECREKDTNFELRTVILTPTNARLLACSDPSKEMNLGNVWFITIVILTLKTPL